MFGSVLSAESYVEYVMNEDIKSAYTGLLVKAEANGTASKRAPNT